MKHSVEEFKKLPLAVGKEKNPMAHKEKVKKKIPMALFDGLIDILDGAGGKLGFLVMTDKGLTGTLEWNTGKETYVPP